MQPDHPMLANNVAYMMLEHGGNKDVALSLAQVARRGLPESPLTADTLAWAYYQKGTYGLAVDLLEEALKKSPQNPNYHFHLGLTYQKMNNKASAKEHLERVLQVNPKFPQADDVRKALSELSQG
ncbi:MAG: tetratricopeptide repeat protein [Acidobacteriia bacterium]|nr:tetratricopeptide repeat protein [Terriglobia bacterium]